jgi:hypothetical protein
MASSVTFFSSIVSTYAYLIACNAYSILLGWENGWEKAAETQDIKTAEQRELILFIIILVFGNTKLRKRKSGHIKFMISLTEFSFGPSCFPTQAAQAAALLFIDSSV